MIRHVVMFRWQEGVGADHVEATKVALAQLPAAIPQIRNYTFGADIGVNATNFDFAVSAQFDTTADYLTYRDHPAHVAFVQTYAAPFWLERCAVQFEEPTGD
ncbi:MAG: Dabb family protein [Ilumatobacteraceae bacterium]